MRISLWGESHGAQVGVVIDGVPAGIPLAEHDFEADLERRRAGSAGTTPRKESAAPEIIMMSQMGLKCGAQINAARDTTATALMTASTESSRALGVRRSSRTKNGRIV